MTQQQDSALEFPCHFPIKAMGLNEGDFETLVVEIVRRHAPDMDDSQVRTRPSSNGKYLSVTVTIVASSREQMDNIYMELTACEQVVMAL